jgi:hypothetical protein
MHTFRKLPIHKPKIIAFNLSHKSTMEESFGGFRWALPAVVGVFGEKIKN